MEKSDWKNFFEKKVGKCKVLVVGDIMIDKYYYGNSQVMRPSPLQKFSSVETV